MNQQTALQHDSTILVVDDTEQSLNMLVELLQLEGYRILQAQYGELAILTAQTRAPELILLDIRMPGMDGYEVCRRLKADPVTSSIPIIFLSALDDTEAKVEGFHLGAVDYISKPYHSEEVLARVRTQLELGNLRRTLEQRVALRTQQLLAEVTERTQATLELMKSRQELQELSWHLEEVREAERKHLARELHDELGQVLTVQRLELKQLADQIEQPPDILRNRILGVLGMLDKVADMARNISESLRPGMLDVLGLSAAVKQHVSKFGESSGIQCSLQMNRDDFTLDSRTATAIFRILQEALTNVARHARARNVDIRLAELASELILVVEDDGCGMQQKQPGERHGFGLFGMQERVKLLGGELLIESDSGQGTRIEANFPLGVTT